MYTYGQWNFGFFFCFFFEVINIFFHALILIFSTKKKYTYRTKKKVENITSGLILAKTRSANSVLFFFLSAFCFIYILEMCITNLINKNNVFCLVCCVDYMELMRTFSCYYLAMYFLCSLSLSLSYFECY